MNTDATRATIALFNLQRVLQIESLHLLILGALGAMGDKNIFRSRAFLKNIEADTHLAPIVTALYSKECLLDHILLVTVRLICSYI